jgi:hypothetical protein
MEKQATLIALCLGADPPLAKSINFIEFYRFFTFLGPSIEPGKPSPKSASTAYPPKIDAKSGIFRKFTIIIDFIDHYSWLRQFIATQFQRHTIFIKYILVPN